MSDELEQLIMETCDLPTMPSVAEKVLRLVSDPDTTALDLQKVILVDQAMTARILKLANSVFYGSIRKVQTVSDAIKVMGFNTLKSIVLMASSRENYKQFGLTEQMLWEHSLGAAVAAGIIAREARLRNPEEAFVGGLLHDIGKVVMNNSDPQKFADVMQKVYNEQLSFRVAEWEFYGFSHVDVGALVIRKWKLSECLEMAVKHQYEPESLLADPYCMQLTAIINLADQFCLKLGIGHREPVSDLPLDREESVGILKMDPAGLQELLEKVALAYEEERGCFA